MNQSHILFYILFAILLLVFGVLYLTIDDRTYILDPTTVAQPTEEEKAQWNLFRDAVEITAESSDAFKDVLDSFPGKSSTEAFDLISTNRVQLEQYWQSNTLYYADYMALNTDKSMGEWEGYASDHISYISLRDVSQMISARYILLVQNGQFSGACTLIDHHLRVIKNLREGANSLVTYMTAVAMTDHAYKAISASMPELSGPYREEIRFSLERSKPTQNDFKLAMNREYMSFMLQQDSSFSGMPYRAGFYLPRNTANLWMRCFEKSCELCELGNYKEAVEYLEQYIEGMPNVRNCVGSSMMIIAVPNFLGAHKSIKELEDSRQKANSDINGAIQ